MQAGDLQFMLADDGCRIAYRTDGPISAKRTALLIGGLGDDHRLWDSQANLLAHNAMRVVRGDNRCSGSSDAPEKPLSIDRMASDWVAVLDVCKVERGIVVGASMGGLIAQDIAARVPERVERLVLIATARRLPAVARLTFSHWLNILHANAHGHSQVLTDGCLHGFSGDWLESNAETIAAWCEPGSQSAAAFSAQIRAMLNFQPVESLPDIPVLAVLGRHDMLFPVSIAQELVRLAPNVTLEVFECGHAISIECGEALNAALTRFLITEAKYG